MQKEGSPSNSASIVPHPVAFAFDVGAAEPHVSAIAKLAVHKVILGQTVDGGQSTSSSPQSPACMSGLVPSKGPVSHYPILLSIVEAEVWMRESSA